MRRSSVVVLSLLAGCTSPQRPEPSTDPDRPPPAVDPSATARARVREALEAGEVPQLSALAGEALTAGVDEPRVHAAMALGTYHDGITAFAAELEVLLDQMKAGENDHPRGRLAFTNLEAALGRVQEHLAEVAKDRSFAIELCPACWIVDWNGFNGVSDDVARFEVEYDAQGHSVPPEDPRRRPTIRFDHADVVLARGYVAMQRGILDVLLAYDWHELDRMSENPPVTTLRVEKRERMLQARERFIGRSRLRTRPVGRSWRRPTTIGSSSRRPPRRAARCDGRPMPPTSRRGRSSSWSSRP